MYGNACIYIYILYICIYLYFYIYTDIYLYVYIQYIYTFISFNLLFSGLLKISRVILKKVGFYHFPHNDHLS